MKETILKESEHMDDMVMEMPDLFGLESGRVKLSLKEVSLSDLVKECTDKFEALMAEKQFKLLKLIMKT